MGQISCTLLGLKCQYVAYAQLNVCMCPCSAGSAVPLSLTLITDNDISEIQGLSSCHRLSHLSLVSNKIARIANLDSLPLKSLSLVSSFFGKAFAEQPTNQPTIFLSFSFYRVITTSRKLKIWKL